MSFDMVDNVPQSVPVCSFPSKWHACDDNESVLRMIFEGRRLSQRPVSRTHRVTLDWFLERISFGTSVSVRCVFTTDQFADMVTIGAFTTNPWKYFMRLFGIPPLATRRASDRSRAQSFLRGVFQKILSVTCRSQTVRSRTLSRGPGTKQQKAPAKSSNNMRFQIGTALDSDLDKFWFEMCQDTTRAQCEV